MTKFYWPAIPEKNFNSRYLPTIIQKFIKKLEEATGEKFEDSEGAGKEPPIEPPKKEGVGGENKETAGITHAANEVRRQERGFLPPRMRTIMRLAIVSPATGLMVYDTDTQSYWYRGVSSWIKQMEEAITNPDVPEETKAELRKAKQDILNNWAHNKKYADISMSIVRPLTNEHDLEIIKHHQKELMEAYTGIPQEKLQEIDSSLFISKQE